MTSRQYRDKKLAYYGSRGDSSAFWSSHWEDVDWRAWLDGAKGGGLGYFEEPFVKYLPKEGRILEAGCGLGHIVVALRARGYDVEGVEFSEATVSMVRQYLGDCPIRVGDVRNLDYPDEYFDAYISLGVMEHFEGGPDEILREAYRVLKDGGHLLASVPRIHAIRKLKAWLGYYSEPVYGDFYQYAFGAGDFAAAIQGMGFAVEECFYYDPVKGIKDEIALFNYFYKRNKIPQRMLRRMEQSNLLKRVGSHMVLIVAGKRPVQQ
jgi:SAM-dependent methyltransferase